MASASGVINRTRIQIVSVLTSPPILAFLPAATLAAWWLGDEMALIATALGVPFLYMLAGVHTRWPIVSATSRDGLTGLIQRRDFESQLTQIYENTGLTGGRSACFIIDLPELSKLAENRGQVVADEIVAQTAERLAGVLRDDGHLARIGDRRFAICLAPSSALDLELAIQLAGTLHGAAEMPVTISGATHYPACSLGFCLRSQIGGELALNWMAAALDALSEARRAGSSGIHAYSTELQQRTRLG